MENIRRSIKLFFTKYGKLLFIIAIGFVAFIFILKFIDNEYSRSHKSNTNLNNENIINLQKKVNKVHITKEIAEKFIIYCTDEAYEDAYNMLAEECIENNFKTKQDFIENFIYKKLDRNKKYYCKKIEANTYGIYEKADLLKTGGKENISSIAKIKVIQEETEKIMILEE